jgi:hypothetical protein
MKRYLLFILSISVSVCLSANDMDHSRPGDVLLNEVMADPTGLTELPATEYVEIYNVSGEDRSLSGWKFLYDGKETALPDVLLPAGGYAVLFRSGSEINVAAGALSLGIDKFPSALANTGKTIGLKNSQGVMIDEFAYPQATRGKSCERSDDGTWHTSTDEKGGTPGAENSDPQKPDDEIIVEPFEIVINEILPDPFVGGSEYIELFNRSGRPLSLTGLAVAVRKADGKLSTHYPLKALSTSCLPESYTVLTKQPEGVTNSYATPSPEAIFEINMPALNNEGATIVLFRISDEAIIDEVAYSEKWHDASMKATKGISLERISPHGKSQDSYNWTSAVAEAGYGTPGYKNSQFRDGDTANETFITTPEYIPGSDSYSLAYKVNKTGYRCRAEIYALNGKKIAEISSNQLIAPEGRLRWDGRGVDNSRLSHGIYIFYAELYHPDGDHIKIKNACLIR